MAIVAYVSGHGLGHSAREVTVLRGLPEEIPLYVKTVAPEWFWRAEVKRPFTLIPESFDVGCLQTDSITVDVNATRAAWSQQNRRNEARREAELAWLQSIGILPPVRSVSCLPAPGAAATIAWLVMLWKEPS